MRLVADTGTIASQSRSSLTASSRSPTVFFDTASIFVTIATFFARGNASSCSLMKRSPGPIFSSAGRQKPITSTSPSVAGDDVVQPLAEQGARAVDAGSVDDDELPGCRVHDPADRAPGGLRLRRRDRHLLADERVRERRLAHVRAADERHEPGAVSRSPWRHSTPIVSPAPVRPAERLLRVDQRLIALDDEGAQQLAPTLDALGAQDQPGHDGARAGLGQPADRLGEQAARRVDVVVVELDAEQVAELVLRQARARPGRRRRPRSATSGLVAVVLVGDVADELLDEVLHGDQARDAAVLVDDHREVVRVELHLPQGVVGLLRLGDEQRRAREIAGQRSARRPAASRSCRRATSRRYRMPSTSSASLPTTGMRDTPVDRNWFIASPTRPGRRRS